VERLKPPSRRSESAVEAAGGVLAHSEACRCEADIQAAQIVCSPASESVSSMAGGRFWFTWECLVCPVGSQNAAPGLPGHAQADHGFVASALSSGPEIVTQPGWQVDHQIEGHRLVAMGPAGSRRPHQAEAWAQGGVWVHRATCGADRVGHQQLSLLLRALWDRRPRLAVSWRIQARVVGVASKRGSSGLDAKEGEQGGRHCHQLRRKRFPASASSWEPDRWQHEQVSCAPGLVHGAAPSPMAAGLAPAMPLTPEHIKQMHWWPCGHLQWLSPSQMRTKLADRAGLVAGPCSQFVAEVERRDG